MEICNWISCSLHPTNIVSLRKKTKSKACDSGIKTKEITELAQYLVEKGKQTLIGIRKFKSKRNRIHAGNTC